MKIRFLIIGIIAFVVGAASYLVIFYDLTPSTTVNDFGISARIVHGFDDRIMCPIEPCDTSIYLMHIHSEMPRFVTGYDICNGLACISINDSQLFVGPDNDPRNQIVYLSKDVPWQVGDIVNIQLDVSGSVSVGGKNFPDPQKGLHLDLGNSIVVEQNNPYSSIGMSEKNTNQKLVEHSLTVHGLNETYSVGQKIEFTVKFDGIWYDYEYPQLRIEDSNHENVWKNNDIPSLWDSDLKKEHIKKEWKIGDNIYFVAPIIDKEGFYTLSVTFGDDVIQRDFWIKSESNVKSEDKLSTITESFKEKYDAVVEGTILWCMGHKSYPIKYQCDVQVEQYIKFDGEKTPQLTILGYRETYTDNGQKAIFGLDYHENENYYEIMERVLLENEN